MSLDIGFRVLKIDSPGVEENAVKKDRTPLDLLFETAINAGIMLSEPYTEETIGHNKVFDYARGKMIACFDRFIAQSTFEAITARKPKIFAYRPDMENESILRMLCNFYENSRDTRLWSIGKARRLP